MLPPLISFRLQPENVSRLLFSLALGLMMSLAAVPLQAGGNKANILFRVHVQTQNQGLATTQAFPVFLDNPPDRIMVRRIPAIHEADVESVEEIPSNHLSGVRIRLKPVGARKLQVETLENQGRVMVVFVNGRIVYSPKINTVIGHGELVIPRGILKEEIEAFKKWLKKKAKE